jgi:hypothetical protein
MAEESSFFVRQRDSLSLEQAIQRIEELPSTICAILARAFLRKTLADFG